MPWSGCPTAANDSFSAAVPASRIATNARSQISVESFILVSRLDRLKEKAELY
jgi:hypothetical protein